MLIFACQVVHRPSIGRYTKLEEPKARESLLSPSMKRSPSKASLRSSSSNTSLAPSSSSTLTPNIPLESLKDLPRVPDSTGTPLTMSMVQAANAALMERTPFAIDDAKDDDEDDDDNEFGIDDTDDQVMDEVRCQNLFFYYC